MCSMPLGRNCKRRKVCEFGQSEHAACGPFFACGRRRTVLALEVKSRRPTFRVSTYLLRASHACACRGLHHVWLTRIRCNSSLPSQAPRKTLLRAVPAGTVVHNVTWQCKLTAKITWLCQTCGNTSWPKWFFLERAFSQVSCLCGCAHARATPDRLTVAS